MGSLTIFDHTEERWSYRFRKSNRENGANTYSKDIVEHHLPLWESALDNYEAVISTCPRLLNMDISGDLVVQYLHTYPYKTGLSSILILDKQLKFQFPRRIYVTAYKSLHFQALAAGFETWHIPMAVDTYSINPVPSYPHEHYGEKSAAYYGNLLGGKVDPFIKLREEFRYNGWNLTQIKGPQRDCWHELTKFNYGVGVGRCALEMMHLGLRVMISGSQFGGIMTTDEEFDIQRDTNFNGRVTTFDREISACLAAWDLSVKGRTVPITYATDALAKYLSEI